MDVCLLLPGGGRDIGTLDNNGNYAFPNEAPGTYTLLFINSATLTCGSSPSSTSAYWPQWYQWGNAAAQATPIVTTPAQSSISLNTVTLTAMGTGTNGEEYNYSRPTITGTAVVGSTLTAHAGSWFPAPDSVTLQWKANGVAIAGATGSTYSLMATDSGKTITVTETASGQFVTTATATSDATATVTGGTLTAPTPTITGTAKVGSVLTAGPGTWAPAPVALTYQWKANGANISGATANTYTVAASLVGETITVAVTGSKAGYTSTTRTSAPTAAVAAGALNAPTPTITGTAKVGSVLTAGPGTWAPAPVALTYQWKANGASISGATANTYTVAASLVGQTITVTVTGTKTGYTTTAKTSTATAAVVAGTLSAPTPTITGTAKVGSVLTAHPGTWAPSPVTLTYQWKANGANISGATGTTYAVVAGNVGKKITVTVTGTKTGYTTTAKTSTATAAVVAGTLTRAHPDDHRHRQGRQRPHGPPRHLGTIPDHPHLPMEGKRRQRLRCNPQHLLRRSQSGRQEDHRHRHRNQDRLHHNRQDQHGHRSGRRRNTDGTDPFHQRNGKGGQDADRQRRHVGSGPGHSDVPMEGQRHQHRRRDREDLRDQLEREGEEDHRHRHRNQDRLHDGVQDQPVDGDGQLISRRSPDFESGDGHLISRRSADLESGSSRSRTRHRTTGSAGRERRRRDRPDAGRVPTQVQAENVNRVALGVSQTD